MQPPELAVPVGPQDHLLGSGEAPVTLLEYADYECPYCREAQPVVAELRSHFGDKLRYAFRHYPLQMHPRALPAALAAEAASAQGKFWEMHRLLFGGPARLSDSDFARFAAEAGLDVPRFERDLAARAGSETIARSKAGADESGLEGTPQFFINGYRWDEGADYDGLRETIDAALAYEGETPQ